MPRPGVNRGGRRSWNGNENSSNKYLDEHDDRDRKITDVKRRVTFKHSGGPRKNGVRISDISIKTHLEEDDIMGEGYSGDYRNFKSQGRGGKNNRGGRRGSPVPPRFRGGFNKPRLITSPSGWYSVIIPHGQKYDKNFLLRNILNAIQPEVFVPYYFKVNPTDVSFYVDDFAQAEAIYKADRQIETPDGFKVILKVRSGVPNVAIDDNVKEKMKLAMVKRYSATTKAMNLEKFHADPDLGELFCSLARPATMLAAIDIIAENVEDIEALNLDNNKITNLDHLRSLPDKVPNLKVLYLGNNKISSFTTLDALKGLSLTELKLTGNPVTQRTKDQTHYVSEIRKRFPKVIKLDGIELPPPIGFDISNTAELPKATASFICEEQGASIVRQFLEQYFTIYDSDNRQPLLDAYHEQAMLSLTVTYLPPANNQNRMPQQYISSNRNLLRVRDLEQRCRHLKVGRLPVVSFLSELPATKHDPSTMSVDLTLLAPNLLNLVVSGVFKEKVSKDKIRSFTRCFIIVPQGSGFCIRNEVVHICNATNRQEKNSFQSPISFTPSAAAPPPTLVQASSLQSPMQQAMQPMPSTSAATPVDSNGELQKMQMIQALSAQTNMNLVYSRKCLEEKNWNFDEACCVFAELQKTGRIPPEAFYK